MIPPLEDQVAPLALCRRLKELGAPQSGLWAWHESPPGKYFVTGITDYNRSALPLVCIAYTVAELGAMLPDEVAGMRYGGLWIFNTPRPYSVYAGSKNEADVRARLLIALVERGVVKFP